MTFEDLKQHVRMYAGRSPHHLIQVASEQELARFIDAKRKEWAERSKCSYAEASALTTAANQPLYDLQSGALGDSFIEVLQVTIDSTVLTNYSGNPGPVTQHQMFKLSNTHQTAAAGKPRFWSYSFPRSIRLWPTPDAVYDDCFAAGYTYLPTLAADDDDVLLPDYDFDNHARWLAGHCINPTRDKEDAARRQWLIQEGEAYLAMRAADYQRRAMAGMAQGVSRSTTARLA